MSGSVFLQSPSPPPEDKPRKMNKWRPGPVKALPQGGNRHRRRALYAMIVEAKRHYLALCFRTFFGMSKFLRSLTGE